MDAEQFNEFEQRLKLADEYEHPLPDEKAWEAMSAKLDDAFGKEKKRRFIWILLMPLLVLVTPAIFLRTKVDQSIYNKAIPQRMPAVSSVSGSPRATLENGRKSSEREGRELEKSTGQKRYAVAYELPSYPRVNQALSKNEEVVNSAHAGNPHGLSRDHESISLYQGTNTNEKGAQPATRQDRIADDSTSNLVSSVANPSIAKQTDRPLSPGDTLDQIDQGLKTEHQLQGSKIALPVKMYITVSLSPNKSFASSGDGKWAITYGGSVGHSIGKRWFIEAGAYAGRALYSAGPKDYKWEVVYGYNLKSLEANCFIIDLPLNLGYTIYKSRDLQIFSTAGVSSQLMKQEKYDYTTVREPLEYKGTLSYKNENKHFLSAAHVSLGISYVLGQNLSFRAAPYFKRSFKGIGAGDVELNSAGINLELQVFPFYKRKK